MMTLATALLIALPQDGALEFLKKVEEKAVEAKSLHWKATARIVADGDTLSFAVEGSFKEGNRARVSATSSDEKAPITFAFTCDGKRIRAESSKIGAKDADADPGFAVGLNRILLRGGLFAVNHLDPSATGEGLAAGVKVSEAVLADDKVGERPAKVIGYTLDIGGNTASVRLWVDPTTLAPLRRELTSKKAPIINETYEEWTPGAELADGLFKGESK